MEREDLKNMLGEFMPVHVHTKQLAAAKEEKLVMGNLNQVLPHPLLDLNQQFTPLKHQYLQCVAFHHLHYTCSALTRFAKGHKPFFSI